MRRGLGILELLVLLAVVGVIVAVAVPSVAMLRQSADREGCATNLRALGAAIERHRADHDGLYPRARYMPEPFLSADADPPLTAVLPPLSDSTAACPGDRAVHPLATISYMYRVGISGQRLEQYFPVRAWGLAPSEVPIANDFDGGTFDLSDGTTLTVPFFHHQRNLVYADGHVGSP